MPDLAPALGPGRSRPPARRLGRSLLFALAFATLAPWSVSAAGYTSTAATVVPQIRTVDVNLYRAGSVAYQYTNYWCVPANAQTMLNIVNRTTDRTYHTQARYAWHVNQLNRYDYATKGNDVGGWAAFLDLWIADAWHYRDHSYDSRSAAIAAMVESIDRTHHPIGIVVDNGTHAWTVLGYRATMVRGSTKKTVVGLYVSGSLAGTDPRPYRYYTLAQFATRYTRYHEWQRTVIWEGKYVIVSE
ncbi:MAG: hypothetical protein ACJ77B_06155 [Chloroflexota bacterium]